MVRAMVRVHNESQSYSDMALADLQSELLQQTFKEVEVYT